MQPLWYNMQTSTVQCQKHQTFQVESELDLVGCHCTKFSQHPPKIHARSPLKTLKAFAVKLVRSLLWHTPLTQKQTWGFRLRKAYLSLGWNWRGLPFRKWSWITINLHPITLHTKSQLNGNRSLCFFLPFIIILIRLWQVLRCDEASACAKQQWARVLDVEASLNCS